MKKIYECKNCHRIVEELLIGKKIKDRTVIEKKPEEYELYCGCSGMPAKSTEMDPIEKRPKEETKEETVVEIIKEKRQKGEE